MLEHELMTEEQFPGDLFQFPSTFALKIIGKNSEDFEVFVVSLVSQQLPGLNRDKISSRLSRDGTYIAVTVEITPQSKEQLDTIYKELTRQERVLMVL
jgi:putative lipoic acid-binding regulatory protein